MSINACPLQGFAAEFIEIGEILLTCVYILGIKQVRFNHESLDCGQGCQDRLIRIPLVKQDVKADITFDRVDVGMPDLCSGFDCGWLCWVVPRDSDLEEKSAALIARARWTDNSCFPMEEITIDAFGSQEFVRQVPGFAGNFLESIVLCLESFERPDKLKRGFFSD